MDAKPEEVDSVFAGVVLKKRAEALIQELSILRRHPAGGSIHDTRVQSRRMRAALEAFRFLFPKNRSKALYDFIRKITKSLGVAREVEVILQLLESLSEGGGVAEKLCHEYLQERLYAELERQHKKMNKKLRAINVMRLRSRIELLLAGIGANDAQHTGAALKQTPEFTGHAARRRLRARQAELFPLQPRPIERGQKVLTELAAPILAFHAGSHFRRAGDGRLHRLRIATKKLRYAMEIFETVWPLGLEDEIKLAKALQDTAGHHQDLAVLRARLRAEIRRLTKQKMPHLAFQVARLLTRVEARKTDLRKEILPAILQLQQRLEIFQNPEVRVDFSAAKGKQTEDINL